ncbi:unnamed protein product [Psylliodes chrysocephalus]|uniref:Uncharacterized protein n=1 Tax=Psylliodes chrysocephalus TaxID=3402493 RepID=A0A9P0CP38_9CUCU|nr:unnamed protein product [Psylliodes chrysocephala]
MSIKLILCFTILQLTTVVLSAKSCWGQTAISDVQKLYKYCKNTVSPDSSLEYRVQNFNDNKSLETLCEDIKTSVNQGSNNSLAIDIFNNCMSLKTTRLGYWQLQKLYDCNSKLMDFTLQENVLIITNNHIGDKKIYKSVSKYIDEKKTQDNKKAINDFYDCLGYVEDIQIEYPNRI